MNKHNRFITINYHLTEKCNFSCKYCFAKWDNKDKELIRDLSKVRIMLSSIYTYYTNKGFGNIRLNIVGGEPLLERNTPSVIKMAAETGFCVSMITNGYFLDAHFIDTCIPYMDSLGISIDSLHQKTNDLIGRRAKNNNQLNTDDLRHIILRAKELNPSLQIKVNTVVTQENANERIVNYIESIEADKWKIFQAMPFRNIEYCSDKSFTRFVSMNNSTKVGIFTEDNDEMSNSYIMIDPEGRFFQNSQMLDGKGYQYSDCIHKIGVEKALEQISFDEEKFHSRYVSKDQK